MLDGKLVSAATAVSATQVFKDYESAVRQVEQVEIDRLRCLPYPSEEAFRRKCEHLAPELAQAEASCASLLVRKKAVEGQLRMFSYREQDLNQQGNIWRNEVITLAHAGYNGLDVDPEMEAEALLAKLQVEEAAVAESIPKILGGVMLMQRAGIRGAQTACGYLKREGRWMQQVTAYANKAREVAERQIAEIEAKVQSSRPEQL